LVRFSFLTTSITRFGIHSHAAHDWLQCYWSFSFPFHRPCRFWQGCSPRRTRQLPYSVLPFSSSREAGLGSVMVCPTTTSPASSPPDLFFRSILRVVRSPLGDRSPPARFSTSTSSLCFAQLCLRRSFPNYLISFLIARLGPGTLRFLSPPPTCTPPFSPPLWTVRSNVQFWGRFDSYATN